MELKVDVRCTPLVRVYLEKLYGTPVQFTDGVHKILFYSLISKQPSHPNITPNKHYGDKVTVLISESLYLREGILMTDTALQDFNKSVTDMIYDKMFHTLVWSQNVLNVRSLIKDLILKFCDAEGLDEQFFSYERAKKAYYRYRNRNKPLKISA